jgi:hypothetical protein
VLPVAVVGNVDPQMPLERLSRQCARDLDKKLPTRGRAVVSEQVRRDVFNPLCVEEFAYEGLRKKERVSERRERWTFWIAIAILV